VPAVEGNGMAMEIADSKEFRGKRNIWCEEERGLGYKIPQTSGGRLHSLGETSG
jgi:hypothetical protein